MKMKKGYSKDVKPTKAEKFSFDNLYPLSPDELPDKRRVSNVTPPNTYSSAPKAQENRAIRQDILDAGSFFYNNVDPRRKQELCDSRMVQEDHAAIANLSERAVYHTFNPDEYVEKLSMFNQSTRTKR